MQLLYAEHGKPYQHTPFSSTYSIGNHTNEDISHHDSQAKIYKELKKTDKIDIPNIFQKVDFAGQSFTLPSLTDTTSDTIYQ